MNKGTLISVEGIDGSGKSTLIAKLSQHLKAQGFDTLTSQEPGGTPLGKQLLELLHFHKKNIADQAEYLLFAADRSQHFHEVIVPALKKGTIVISDRMADSSLAYQGYGRNLSLDMIKEINSWVMQGLQPDVVLYLHLDWNTAFSRIMARKGTLTSFEKEKEAFWQRVMNGYETLFKGRNNIIRLDATKKPQEVVDQAVQGLQNRGII